MAHRNITLYCLFDIIFSYATVRILCHFFVDLNFVCNFSVKEYNLIALIIENTQTLYKANTQTKKFSQTIRSLSIQKINRVSANEAKMIDVWRQKILMTCSIGHISWFRPYQLVIPIHHSLNRIYKTYRIYPTKTINFTITKLTGIF